MSSIGETLRRERIRRSLDLDQISRELKISSRFLEAIEDDRFDKLPAGVFAKSFVRQYARLLGLDEEELAGELQRILEPPPIESATKTPHIAPLTDIHVPRVEQWEAVSDVRRRDWSSSLPALALVVVVMLVCSGVYAFWQRARHPITAQVSAPPLQTSPMPSVPTPEPPAQSTEAVPPPNQAPEAGTPVAPAVQPGTAVPGAPASQPPRPENNSADRPAPEVLAPNPDNSATNPNGPVRLQLTAAEPVWVLARANGKYLFSGTLEPNQTRSVEAKGILMLRLGNAGGVNITLNGKPIGSVGPKGQVREIQFTSGGFHIVAVPKPSLPLDKPI